MRNPMPSRGPGIGGRAPRGKMNFPALWRAVKMLYSFYPRLLPFVLVCIIFSSATSAIPSLFTQKVITIIGNYFESGDWATAKAEIIPNVALLATLYTLSFLSILTYTQLMAYMTQGFLSKMREAVFGIMQGLPIGYFDTHQHGEIMSHYTNDVDTLRELVSQTIPAVLRSGSIILVGFSIMLYFSIPMTLLVATGAVMMRLIATKFGRGSAKYFVQRQKSLAKAEGYIQEMMNGQKVVKVFSREKRCAETFDQLNEQLRDDTFHANSYANMLGPITMNIGNLIYVLISLVGGLYILSGLPSLSLSGKVFDISILIAFLNITKQFSGNINQLTQQINHITQGMAGAARVFALMDEAAEVDTGTVTLVNVRKENGTLVETTERTGHWAWKRPTENGAEYTELLGDVRLENVNFSYVEGKEVLHDVSVFAEPGQKVAFVGATGAGKTTITNLINRFYDIDKGSIFYDGIDVKDIKKSDLRRSLGIVLQETNLFTGTVMENIRYGKLDATEEEVIAAAKLAGADDFITRLPNGYDTELTNNGANLSQGQRQLIAIARAAVADPPVMILDEATSSIDTNTEAVVQRGMDQLMHGRTVFVIAHRLSTVMNSDVIMVLEQGRIIERGSHQKLIEDKGTYYQLYTGAFELE